jgi:hypothetical protein
MDSRRRTRAPWPRRTSRSPRPTGMSRTHRTTARCTTCQHLTGDRYAHRGPCTSRGTLAESLPRTFRGLQPPKPAPDANQRARRAADLQLYGADDGIRTRDPNLGKPSGRARDLHKCGSQGPCGALRRWVLRCVPGRFSAVRGLVADFERAAVPGFKRSPVVASAWGGDLHIWRRHAGVDRGVVFSHLRR